METEGSISLLAPVGRDTELLLAALTRGGVPAVKIADMQSATAAIRQGTLGVFLLTAEAITRTGLQDLTDALHAQPHWSDVPVLLLIPGGKSSAAVDQLERVMGSLPNVTLLERPIRPGTLVSVARAALRSRSRQFEIRRVIQERDRASSQLVESEKLAAVGRLASSISHEINNPLEAVTNLLYLVQQDDDLSPSTRDFLQTAVDELQRASHITQQSLRFHRQATKPRSVTAYDLLVPVLAIYRGRLANSHVELVQDVRDQTCVTCYEGEIRQVISNLVGNALDAMRSGGRLRIRAQKSTDRRTQRLGLSILVADTGVGITPGDIPRIFDAFYTTKGIGGTGLGLWISADIVRKHGGSLSVRSRRASGSSTHSGTTFRLFLPETPVSLPATVAPVVPL